MGSVFSTSTVKCQSLLLLICSVFNRDQGKNIDFFVNLSFFLASINHQHDGEKERPRGQLVKSKNLNFNFLFVNIIDLQRFSSILFDKTNYIPLGRK